MLISIDVHGNIGRVARHHKKMLDGVEDIHADVCETPKYVPLLMAVLPSTWLEGEKGG